MLQKDLKNIATMAGFSYDYTTGNFVVKQSGSFLERLFFNKPVILDDNLQLFADLLRENHVSKIIDLLKKPDH